MNNRLRTPSGIPLFRSPAGSVSSQPRVKTVPPPAAHEPTGELHLHGSVITLPDGRFEIRSEYCPEATGFFHGLPEARWVPKQQVWRCLATPLCGWLLRSVGLVIDQGCRELADKWDEQLSPSATGEIDLSLIRLKPGDKVRPAQVHSMEFCLHKTGSALEHQMGVGKTLCSIGLLLNWKSRMVLVLCPKAVLGVWRREMSLYCGVSHRVTVLEGTAQEKVRLFNEAIRLRESAVITMVVCNYESIWREPLIKHAMDVQWDALICDESHRIGSATNRSSVAAFELSQRSRRKLLLTGTPMETPLDYFGQAKVIDPALFGTSFTRFRSKYAVTHEQYRGKVLELLNMDDFNAKRKLVALRYETTDVWDLPPLTHSVLPVTLTSKSMATYQQMRKHCLLELESGEVTAANAGVRLIKLAQLAAGHVKDDNERVTRIGDEKKQVLEDFLTDTPKSEKIVVFCRFTEDLRIVAEVAHKLNRPYGEISSRVKDLTEHAKYPDHVNIMGVQERAGGLGIDLTAARIVIWYSHGYSSRDYDQAVFRSWRPGQCRNVMIYHLIATGTVDESIMQSIENKKEIIDGVLEHVRAVKKR